jgi:iron-sulfur cluster repair protein YtfE (RIC family)
LQASVASLSQAADAAPALQGWQPAARATWLAGLAHRLADLRAKLAGHFESEERAGLYEDLAEADPGRARTAQRLQAEHEQLRRAVERLQAEAEVGRADLTGLADRVRALLRDLEHHETRENEALTRAVADDLGAGD